MHELFAPQGSNPLGNIKVSNPRCSKVEFDRTVRSNVLVIEGDLTQSRVQIPKEDRPVSSLQLNHALVVLQILIPSSGQFLLELNVSSSPVTRMRLSAATFISRADVVDAKGMAHAKIPLVIPRNCWVQIVFHVGGIFTHLFRLPPVKWIDSVVLAGSCKVRKIMTCADEATAIESKPGGMLLFAVPAYGPPVWQTSVAPTIGPSAQTSAATSVTPEVGGAAAAAAAAGDDSQATQRKAPQGLAPATSPTQEVSTRSLAAVAGSQPVRSSEMVAQAFSTGGGVTLSTTPSGSGSDFGQAQSARFPAPQKVSSPTSLDTNSPVSSTNGPQGTAISSPLRMRFLRSDDGTVSFTAKSLEQEAQDKMEKQHQMDIVERLRREAEHVRVREEIERQRRIREDALANDGGDTYVRIVDQSTDANNNGNPITGRKPSAVNVVGGASSGGGGVGSSSSSSGGAAGGGGGNASSSYGQQPRRNTVGVPGRLQNSNGTPTEFDGDVGCWNDEDDNNLMFSSMIAGGVGSSVVQTVNAGGKPIVVLKKPPQDEANAAASAAAKAAKKPLVPRRSNAAGAMSAARSKKVSQPPSMMLLTLRGGMGECHPADDFDPELHCKHEPEVGYGVGFLDVIHGADEEEEEDYEEEEEE